MGMEYGLGVNLFGSTEIEHPHRATSGFSVKEQVRSSVRGRVISGREGG